MVNQMISEVNFKRSLISFLEVNLSIPFFFQRVLDIPKDPVTGDPYDKWVVVSIQDLSDVTLLKRPVLFMVFTTNDVEFFKHSEIFDELYDIFRDETSSNGLKSIPFYDTSTDPFTMINGMLALYQNKSEIFVTTNNTNCRYILYNFCSGS